ncbi:hypothetical protein VTK26DRAFT_7075 [Humicola hyalothermophila]
MDTRDDPCPTTTTTDYDSGDSDGVDYVYEKQATAEKKPVKARSPRRRRSSRAKPRPATKCVCGAIRGGDEAEITVFEGDTDTEEEPRQNHRRKSRHHGHGGLFGCCEGACIAERKKVVDKKPHRSQAPYIEEYPEETPRPAIRLKEHKIPRRFSTSDAKRVRDSDNRSLSSGSRGRSPGKHHAAARPARRSSKESPRPTGRQRHRREYWGNSQSESDEPDASAPPTPRRVHREADHGIPSLAARSSARRDGQHSKYSSSCPSQPASHTRQRQATRRSLDFDSDKESDPRDIDEIHFDERRRPSPTRMSFSFRERSRAVNQERARDHRQRDTPERDLERDGEPRRSRPRARPRTVVSCASIPTMDQGRRSVATSVCEVWQGQPEDWESPYASDDDSDLERPIGLLGMDDVPPRTSSPSLLPSSGERRDFGFQAPSYLGPPSYAPSQCAREPSPGGVPPCPRIYRNQALAAPDTLFLLDGPPLLTMEPETMADEEEEYRAIQPAAWPRHTRGRTYPMPGAPRSRGVSPVFSARRTREVLSPKPTRPARFDFGAWGCDRRSRISLVTGLF